MRQKFIIDSIFKLLESKLNIEIYNNQNPSRN